MLKPLFTLKETASASGATAVTIKSWMKKELVTGTGEDRFGKVRGVKLAFSFRTLMEVAVAKAVLDVAPRDLDTAFLAGKMFSHFDEMDRVMGYPFPEHGTLIAAFGGRATIRNWTPGEDCIPSIRRELGWNNVGFLLVDANEVFRRVCDGLEVNSGELLASVYGSAE